MNLTRTLPALSLAKSPLVFVLGQVRYEPILAMESFIPTIQDTLRRKGFTGLVNRRMETTRIEGDQLSKEVITQWEFQDADKVRGILIDQNAITFQTTDYTSYDDFSEDLGVGLETLTEVAHPQTVQRIGLRYIDLVRATEGKHLESYVCPELRGIHLEKLGRRIGQSNETLIFTGERRRLLARYTEAEQGMPIPLDLFPVNLAFKKPISQSEPFAVLDTDHFEQLDREFGVESVLTSIGGLHDVLDQVFRVLVTKEALKEWE
ncbi:MAG TPA: TIGR04255 family protein [Fimbriimonas sp.]|nr:TIGR04255 family protein [Fimbriimonas sp.]